MCIIYTVYIYIYIYSIYYTHMLAYYIICVFVYVRVHVCICVNVCVGESEPPSSYWTIQTLYIYIYTHIYTGFELSNMNWGVDDFLHVQMSRPEFLST